MNTYNNENTKHRLSKCVTITPIKFSKIRNTISVQEEENRDTIGNKTGSVAFQKKS